MKTYFVNKYPSTVAQLGLGQNRPILSKILIISALYSSSRLCIAPRNCCLCRTLTCDQIPALIAKIAPSYQKDKKLTTPEAAIAEITEKLAGASKDLASGTTVRTCL